MIIHSCGEMQHDRQASPDGHGLRRITLNSFRRITRSGTFIPEVDGLRFIAIVSVIFLHCYAEQLNRMAVGLTLVPIASKNIPLPVDEANLHGLFRFLGHGGYGVDLFFAISGFILAWPFARQHLQSGRRVELRSYFLRRITRLEPPYILALLIRATLLLATGLHQVRFILVHLVASLFYVHNIAFGIGSRIEAVSWSLEIEVQFYCLAPLLTLIYKIPKAWIRRALLVSAIVSATPLQRAFLPGWYGLQNAGAFNLSILAVIQFFLVGLLVADLYVDGWDLIPQTWRWDLLSVPLWLFIFWLQPHAFRFLGPLILPILFVGAFKGSFVPGILRNPVISTIGGMCYSIYLTHRTTILGLQFLLARFHLHFAAWLTTSLILGPLASIAVGAVYFRLIERPCMDPRWPQKLVARFRSGPRGRPPANASVDLDASRHLAKNTGVRLVAGIVRPDELGDSAR
jgi:peptidoglycan/LPS O-acetylase OafA/YrhL